MDFNDSPEEAAFRIEVRTWLEANAPKKVDTKKMSEPEILKLAKAWQATKAAARFTCMTWPEALGGRGATPIQNVIYNQEESKFDVPRGFFDIGLGMCVPTVMAFANDETKQRFVAPAVRGEEIWCQLFSEPSAGSDVAGLRTRAVKDGDDWVINGQKVWTSGAAVADYGMLVARTDWDVPKHKGISFFFLPMKQPGIEVRPLRQITNEAHFNEVFITDAIVPADNMLGPLNNGWGVLQTALAYERSVMGDAARGPRSGQDNPKGDGALVELAREAGRLNDPVIRQEVAQVTAYKVLNRLNNARAKAELAQGNSSPIMSLGKLAMSRILHEEARLRSKLLGAGSLLEGPDHPRAEDANFLSLNAYFTSIGGGTDQIQRNIIGERVLGLPKEPEVDRDMAFRDVRSG